MLIHVFGRWILPLLVLAKNVAAADESWLIRVREEALARAVKAKDQAAILKLTDESFHLHWSVTSPMGSFLSAELDRQEWIDSLMHLRIDSYDAVISKVDVIKGREAFVDMDEFWTVLLPGRSRIEKRFTTRDGWFKIHGVWKVTGRFSHGNLR